jgi:hypothetical protein
MCLLVSQIIASRTIKINGRSFFISFILTVATTTVTAAACSTIGKLNAAVSFLLSFRIHVEYVYAG